MVEVMCCVLDHPIVMSVTATPTKKIGMPLVHVVVHPMGNDCDCIPTIWA
jgi:hypothetical protein